MHFRNFGIAIGTHRPSPVIEVDTLCEWILQTIKDFFSKELTIERQKRSKQVSSCGLGLHLCAQRGNGMRAFYAHALSPWIVSFPARQAANSAEIAQTAEPFWGRGLDTVTSDWCAWDHCETICGERTWDVYSFCSHSLSLLQVSFCDVVVNKPLQPTSNASIFRSTTLLVTSECCPWLTVVIQSSVIVQVPPLIVMTPYLTTAMSTSVIMDSAFSGGLDVMDMMTVLMAAMKEQKIVVSHAQCVSVRMQEAN